MIDEKAIGKRPSGGNSYLPTKFQMIHLRTLPEKSKLRFNIIFGTAAGERKFQKIKTYSAYRMNRLWFDVTHLFEELLNA